MPPAPSPRLSPRPNGRSSCARLIPLDDALAARSLQITAEFVRLVRRIERPDLRAVERALATDIGLADHRASVLQLSRELGLQRLIGRLGVRFALLRRALHHEAAGDGGL